MTYSEPVFSTSTEKISSIPTRPLIYCVECSTLVFSSCLFVCVCRKTNKHSNNNYMENMKKKPTLMAVFGVFGSNSTSDH